MAEQAPLENTIRIKYEVFASAESLPQEEQQLLLAAREASKNSYAPYSRFHVGAALRLRNGTVLQGSNQENASYGLTLCAERTALAVAGAQGHGGDIVQIAVIGLSEDFSTKAPVPPCGACRQWLREFEDRSGNPISIIASGNEGPIYKFDGVSSLLPFSFGPSDLSE